MKMIFSSFISILVVLSSILTLTVKNPVHSVFFLILVFCGISALTCSLQISFLGIIFIIVYVGAIAVLFLFVVMMLNVRYLELKENYLRYLPISLILVFTFLLQFVYLFKLNYTSMVNQTMYTD
jgi:NADH-quinone oxidoreductase subunit J